MPDNADAPASAHASPPFTRQSLVVVAVCFLVLVLENYDLSMFGGIVPALLEYRPWALTPNEVSGMASLGVTGMLAGSLCAAALADHLGRRKVLIGAIATFSIAIGLSAFASTPGLFGFMRFAVGVGAGALTPIATAVLIEFAPPGRRNQATALGFAGLGLGGILAGVLAAILVPRFGFRSMCVVGFLPAVLVLPLALRFVPESPAFAVSDSQRLSSEGATLAAPSAPSRSSSENPSAECSSLTVWSGPPVLADCLLLHACGIRLEHLAARNVAVSRLRHRLIADRAVGREHRCHRRADGVVTAG